MSGKKLFLLTVFGLLVLYAVWRGMRTVAPQAGEDSVTLDLHRRADAADLAPVGVEYGEQPSFPSPDILAADSAGNPGDQPLFFGGSVSTAI